MAGMEPNLDYSKIPSAAPPPGVISNFVNPETNAAMMTVVITILLPLTLLFVSMRVYSNLWVSHKFFKSDYACVLAMAAAISFTAVLYLLISQHIIGRHMWDVPVSMDTNSAVQNFTVISILYGPAIFLAKLSVLLLYLELFVVNAQTKILIALGITLITAQCVAQIIGSAITCVPKPGVSWLVADNTYKCRVTADLFGVVMSAIAVFTDLFVIFIPLPVVWQLRMSVRKKIGVSLIFLTGLLAVVASVLNLVYRIKQYNRQDNTWNASYTYMLVAVEINVSIMCACMPSCAHYLRHHMQTLHSLSSRLREKYLSVTSSRKNSSSMKLGQFERADSNPSEDDKMRLTLGSAVRDGKFLTTTKTERSWPLAGVDEHREENRTRRDNWEQNTQTTQGSMA